MSVMDLLNEAALRQKNRRVCRSIKRVITLRRRYDDPTSTAHAGRTPSKAHSNLLKAASPLSVSSSPRPISSFAAVGNLPTGVGPRCQQSRRLSKIPKSSKAARCSCAPTNLLIELAVGWVVRVVGKQDIRLQRVISGLCRLEGRHSLTMRTICRASRKPESARIIPKERGYANYARHAR